MLTFIIKMTDTIKITYRSDNSIVKTILHLDFL